MDDLRIYCVVRMDIEMPVGKLVAQTGHAFMGALMAAPIEVRDEYLANAFTKIAVRGKNLNALLRAEKDCAALGIPVALITDNGRTVFTEPTVTCVGIGPCRRDDLPKFVRDMQLLA